MKSTNKFLFALALLALTAMACAALSGLGDTALLRDDFEGSSIEWGTGTDADSSVEFEDGGLRMKVFTENFIVWSYPTAEPFENIHVEVTVKNNGTDPLTGIGIICNLQEFVDTFYLLAITPNGDYAIADKPLAQDAIYLTSNGQWEVSNLISLNADTYRLGADCGNGNLTLYVDGQQIDSVFDSTYTSGSIGLLVWSDVEVNNVDVTFDDLVVTKLP